MIQAVCYKLQTSIPRKNEKKSILSSTASVNQTIRQIYSRPSHSLIENALLDYKKDFEEISKRLEEQIEELEEEPEKDL
jgi:hypothetical protein